MKILWFIGLKIVEIGGVVFAPYYLGKLIHSWTDWFCLHGAATPSCTPMWILGFVGILLAICAIGLLAITCVFAKQNWEWAGKLSRKFKK